MRQLFKEMFGEMSAWGRFWLFLGLMTLVWAAAMSYSFGSEISFKHAAFLTCLSAVAAFLPDAARQQWDDGRRSIALVLGLLALPTLLIEFYTHAGYTAGLRGSNIETAQVQNMRHDGAQKTAEENAALLASFKAQLAKFRSENEWTTTASADALRKELTAHDKAIELETARKGCKVKCLALMEKKAAVEAKIAVIEKGNDLAKKIDGMQAVVDKKRDVAATVEHKSSAVDHQNKFLAKSVSLISNGSLNPSEILTESATQTVNLAMALAGTGLPALALFIAGLYRRRDDDHTHPHQERSETVSSGDASPAPLGAPAPRTTMPTIIHKHTTNTVQDLRARDMVAELAANFGRATAGYRAAA